MSDRSDWIAGYPEDPITFLDREGHHYTIKPMRGSDGKSIVGLWVTAASWKIHNSWVGSTMYQIECHTFEDRRYTGRGFGVGMLWQGRPKKERRR